MSWRGIGRILSVAAGNKPAVGTTPSDVFVRENKWRLLRYRPLPGVPQKYDTPVLLVPSLINRHYVLDLMPGKSFAEALLGRGHPVFAIDWGTPGDEDRFLTFDDVVEGYLGRAVRAAARTSRRGAVHMVGYCLGGTMAAIYAAARPEKIATFTAIAAPVRFDDGGLLSRWTRTSTFDVGSLISATGNVPWQLMQSAFHMLRPTLNLSKAVHVLDRIWDDEFLDGFLALETWGNDNVSFPGEAYRTLIEDLYRGNALINGTFSLKGTPAPLEAIRCPVLAVTFGHDHIVPEASAAELLEKITSTDKTRIHIPGGHVGGMVSRKAAATLWPKFSAWWAQRDQGAVPEAARKAAAPN